MWQKMFFITLPSISSSIILMLIISIGNIFSVDLDRILLMYNPSAVSYTHLDVYKRQVYAGTGCVSTKDTIRMSKKAQALGADVLSVITLSLIHIFL